MLDGGATLKVLLDLGRVFAVESLQLLVKLLVALVDVVDVGVLVKWPTTTVLGTLRDSPRNKLHKATNNIEYDKPQREAVIFCSKVI